MKNRSFTFLSLVLYCAMSLFASTLVHANNLPPVAVIDLTPDKAVYYHGETIALYGGNSYVQSSGNINYYQWYINGELKLQGSGATSYNHTVVMQSGLAQQSLTIRLRVRHSNGLWGEQTITRTEKQKPGQHYYLTDHLGSVRATVNAAGTLIGWDDFYPFGMVMPGRSSNTANPNDLYKFTGHERDREAGLEIDFMNARTYDSEIGRFLQRDPHAANYPGISPYVYVANNPLIFIDPDGRDIRITRNDEDKTILVEGNFYYNSSQLDPGGNFGSVEALISNLNSWATDIVSAVSEMGLGDYSVSVNFSMKEVDIGDLTGEDAIAAIRAEANVDQIGNSIVHDPSHPRASVSGNKHMTANMSLSQSDPYLFAGRGDYTQGSTLKHEIGHFFGLRDRGVRNGNAPHIPRDLMSYDPVRNNAVQPFIRVMNFTGLDKPGMRSVIVNKNKREPLK